MKSSPTASTSPPVENVTNGNGTAKKRRRRKRKDVRVEHDDDEMKATLNEVRKRHSKGAKNDEDAAISSHGPVLRKTAGKYAVHQPSAYGNIMARAEERLMNKVDRPTTGVCVPTPNVCAICQHGMGVKGLGDLFGPYYTPIDAKNAWPPYIKRSVLGTLDELKAPATPTTANDASRPKKCRKSSSSMPSELYTELWMHGDCALWTPQLTIHGAHVPNAMHILGNLWRTTCASCGKKGASLTCDVAHCQRGTLHYECAVTHDYELDAETFIATCAEHANKKAPIG